MGKTNKIVTRLTVYRPKEKGKADRKSNRKPAKPKFKYVYKNTRNVISREIKDEIKKLGYIPYSWDDVDIYLNDAKIIATGMLKGIKRYLYKKEFRDKQNDKKCDRMIAFGKELDHIKKNIHDEMHKYKPSKTKVIATGLWLLLASSIRVGNKKYLRENGTYGLTTLNKKHIKLSSKHIELNFIGKKSVPNYVKVRIPDTKTYNWLKCMSANSDKCFLQYNNQRINSTEINEYIKDFYGEDFTAKDFRTWGANIIFLEEVANIDLKNGNLNPKEINKIIKEIIEHTAEMLNNTPGVLKSNYLCPHILQKLKENPEKLVKKIRASKDLDKLLIELL